MLTIFPRPQQQLPSNYLNMHSTHGEMIKTEIYQTPEVREIQQLTQVQTLS